MADETETAAGAAPASGEPASPGPGPSPFLTVAGAVAMSAIVGDEDVDAGAVAHYGRFPGDQRALAAGRAIVDVSHFGVVRVSGRDRLTWLDSLTSQWIRDLAPGASAESLLLDVQGRVEDDLRLVDDGESAWIVPEAGRAAALAAFLDRMRFLMDVRVEDVSADFGVVATLAAGEGADAVEAAISAAEPAGVPLVWRDPWAAPPSGGTTYSPFRGDDAHHPGHDLPLSLHIVTRERLAELADAARSGAASFEVAGFLALEALRIAAWRPRLAREVDARGIPHESDWLRSAVHLTKGCYRGQETVAKVHNLGHPPRRLVFLHLDGSLGSLPAPGDDLAVAGDETRKTIGRITSVALHHEDGPIALALVKRSLPADAVLEAVVDGSPVAASQTVIVAADAGAEAHVPRLPRLGGRA